MRDTEKEAIATQLSAYCERMGSQNKAAKTMRGVSSGTISQIVNRNWELITDEMFRKVGSSVGWSEENKTWRVVETKEYKMMNSLMSDAQENALVLAITGDAGCGKSQAIKYYTAGHKEVYALSCSEYWNRKTFMTQLLQTMGVDWTGCTVSEMMGEIIHNLKKQEKPLVILDEADKLSDQVLYFFISLYNALEDECGMVLVATDFLEKRIKKGVRVNKKGYKEIFSRCGRRFIALGGLSGRDIAAIAKANGVTDQEDIKSVIIDSECDLRRVKRKIHALLLKQERLQEEKKKEKDEE
jgi:hypothetical protein